MCEEEAVRYLRDLCGEKEALERAQDKQLIATKLVAQGTGTLGVLGLQFLSAFIFFRGSGSSF